MDVTTETVLDLLTPKHVNVLKTNWVIYNGKKTQLGSNFRKSYSNSNLGRSELIKDLEEPYLSAVLALWGDTPTVFYNDDDH